MTEPTCIFCRIVRGEIPADRVFETDDLIAFRDVDPRAPVHVLLIPREHIASLGDTEPGHAELVGRLLLAAGEIARAEGVAKTGWRVVTNVGPDAGQSVDHLHVHLLGGRAMQWPPG